MGIPEALADLMFEDDGNMIIHFMNNLQDIFACTKYDIVSFCQHVDQESLAVLRADLFTKLTEVQPSLTDYELCNRKKKNKMCEDIYTLGYSIVNGLEDNKVKYFVRNIAKKTNTKSDDSRITLNSSDI